MKKKWLTDSLYSGILKKTLRIMRLTIILIAGFVLTVNAKSYSQSTRLDVQLKNSTIMDVIEFVEKNSKFVFLYKNEDLNINKKLDVNLKNAPIEQILKEVFEGENVVYDIYDRQIVVRKAETLRLKLQQDQKGITGIVTGRNGESIPGVSVIIKGTSIGTVSDMDGKFYLDIPTTAEVLQLSFVGMVLQEIEIAGKTNFVVVMEEMSIGVDEVIVVGYGTQQKKTVTGAVSTVNASQLRSVPTANAASKLQGRVAGVTIINDNTPGGEATVRIRGIGSVNNNDPLFIIDGVPTSGGLSQINPNDIESMSVLKDASSSAIYGVRAANGVILVTTKRGKSGKPKLSFDARYGVQRTINSLNLMNTQEYGELLWLESRNIGLKQGDNGWGNAQYGYGAQPVVPDYVIPSGAMEGEVDESTYTYPAPYNAITRANKEGTDWSDEILEPAPIHEYNLSVSGGSNKGTYAFSGGYMSQDGIVMNTGFERYSLRSNTNAKINNWLEIGESLGVTYTDRTGMGTNNDEGNAISQVYRMQPIIPVYDIMGNFAGTQASTTGNGANPVAILERDKDDYSRDFRVLANAYIQLNLTPELSAKSLLGVDYSTTRRKDRTIKNPEFSEAIPADILTEFYFGTLQYNWINTLTYKKTIDDVHHFNVLLGSEAVNWDYDWFQGGRSTFASTDLDYMVLDAGEKDQTAEGSFDEWSTFSYFGRINYDYMGKYLAEAVVRRDASSRFSEDNRWGTFPAFSFGWRLSEEDFMEDNAWLDNLKVRFGWGKNGNDNVGGYYNAYTTYRVYNGESYYSLSGSDASTDAGIHKYKLGNPDGKWETSVTTNLGIDITMFNKLEVNLDVFSRRTTDMLYNQSLPDTYGNLELPAVNIGEMKNTGFDLMVSYQETIGNELGLNLRANVSHYKNEIVKLNSNPNEILYGPSLRQNVYTASMTGEPISSFYGYIVDGYFSPDMFQTVIIDEKPQLKLLEGAHAPYNTTDVLLDTYSAPGTFMYKDINGDGQITSDDRTIIGSPHPDFTYGLNIDLNYRNWDLTMFFQGSQGNDLINYVNRWTMFNNFSGNRGKARLYESWTTDRYNSGAVITQPIAIRDDAVMQKNSSFFIEDGSYLRMKDLQIGYNLPSSILKKVGIERLRLYIQATNLFTITNYSGLDPELSNPDDNPDRLMGVDEGIYPASQIFMFGINMNL